MYYAQGYNHKKIINFGSQCHQCQFYSFRHACGGQYCTSDSCMAWTTSSYLMWPASVRTAPMHWIGCGSAAFEDVAPWIELRLGCCTIHCVWIFPYRVPTTLFTSSMHSVNPYDMIHCLHSLYHIIWYTVTCLPGYWWRSLTLLRPFVLAVAHSEHVYITIPFILLAYFCY